MSITMNHVTVMAGDRALLKDITLDLPAGKVTGLIGPNGAGKSTLLATLSGDIQPVSGSVAINNLNPHTAKAKDLARLRSVMLQDVSVSFSFLVRDVVEMGRRPWASTSTPEEDAAIVDVALAATEITHLQDRDVLTLSGGERARVALSRVLAQQSPVAFFDEPTAAMDVRYQERSLALMRALAAKGATVVVVLHDLNAAAAYCDHFVCLRKGELVAVGDHDAVFQDDVLTGIYDWPVKVLRADGGLYITPDRASVPPNFTPSIDTTPARS